MIDINLLLPSQGYDVLIVTLIAVFGIAHTISDILLWRENRIIARKNEDDIQAFRDDFGLDRARPRQRVIHNRHIKFKPRPRFRD